MFPLFFNNYPFCCPFNIKINVNALHFTMRNINNLFYKHVLVDMLR